MYTYIYHIPYYVCILTCPLPTESARIPSASRSRASRPP